MEKLPIFSVITYGIMFVSLAFQIHCDTSIFNGIGRTNENSPSTNVNQQNQKEKDLIKKLPGQPRVSFKQYGGYVAVDELAGRALYYYFVENSKGNDSSPLVVWFNGGPACSSLSAAFLAHGPFRVRSDGKTLYRNPYSWNNEANMLYVETPATVGFSYDKNVSKELNSQGDRVTAEDNYRFLVKWLERFPEYKGREFYIAAQSYGGHFGPQLAQIILHHNKHTFINLRGLLLGNPSLDSDDEDADEEYFMSHALVSDELVARKRQICGPTKPSGINSECWKMEEGVEKLTKHIDAYNIYADVCLNSTLTRKHKKHATVLKFDPCSVNYLVNYLNMEKVQEEMHANTTKLSYPWSQCNEDIILFWNGTERYASMLPVLQELIENGIRFLLFSGDIDSVVPVTATIQIPKKLNLKVKAIWHPWFSRGQVAGFTEEYERNFTFATVRAAGHSVSSDQPIRALTLFTSFIRNIPLPRL